MAPSPLVLYLGHASEAVALADALSATPRPTASVVSVQTPASVPDLADRAACLVVATDEGAAALRDADVSVPVVAAGVDCSGATVTVPAGDDAALADAVVSLLGSQSDAADTGSRPTGSDIEMNTVYRGSDAYFAVDDEWRVTAWDPRMEDRTGRAPEDVLGSVLWDEFPDALETRVYDHYDEVMQSGEPRTFELYYEPGGYWLRVRAYPTDDGGVEFYTRDITERKEREEELRRMQRALDAAPIGIAITDPGRDDNPMVYANDAFCAMTGYDREAVLDRNCRFLQGEDTDPETVATIRDAVDAGEPVSVEILNYRADGEPFWNDLDVAPVRDEDGVIRNWIGFQRDVSERRHLLERLRALHRTAQELMIAETDADIGQVAVEAASEVLEFPITTLWRYSEAEDAFISVARSAGSKSALGRATAEESVVEERVPADELPGWESFQSGGIRVYDDLTGDETTPLASGMVAPLGEYGLLVTGRTEPEAFDWTDKDLFRVLATNTEAALVRAGRERELQRQHDRLDEFVSVVSHDLRNPLQVVMARLDTYRELGGEEQLDVIERNVDRMAQLVEDLLALAREGETVEDPEQVHLSNIAGQAWLTVDAPEATFDASTAATLVADPNRLQQLFENLFRNAVEHGGPEVSITVDTLPNGFYVEDDGPGVPDDRRPEVFEYGHTTTENGTGFGLSIVKQIVEAHGWHVEVTDGRDGGARFEITGVATLTSTG